MAGTVTCGVPVAASGSGKASTAGLAVPPSISTVTGPPDTLDSVTTLAPAGHAAAGVTVTLLTAPNPVRLSVPAAAATPWALASIPANLPVSIVRDQPHSRTGLLITRNGAADVALGMLTARGRYRDRPRSAYGSDTASTCRSILPRAGKPPTRRRRSPRGLPWTRRTRRGHWPGTRECTADCSFPTGTRSTTICRATYQDPDRTFAGCWWRCP